MSATPPPAGWPSSAPPPVRRRPRPSGSAPPGRRPRPARDRDLAGLDELEERLRLAEDTPIDEEPSTEERDTLAALVPQARQNEMEVRLAVRTAEERVSSIAGRADSLMRQANAERQARERAAARRAARARGAEIAKAVALGAAEAMSRVAVSLAAAVEVRDELARARTAREAELQEVRATAKRLLAELERLTNEVHRDEVARAEQRMRIEQLEAKAAEDFSLDVDTLITEYGPDQWVPPTQVEVNAAEAAGEKTPDPVPYHRPTQEKRANKAERDLALLGKVNPLALEEFAALEERFKFLSDQLEDLKATRKDLLTVVKDVDDRILEVFTSAFEDTAREFQAVFQVLFPGGEGRLVLTDPEDMLTTGVEVEARPPGKKIKRLSLLSGGERSLTAVAMLVRDLPGPAQPLLHHGRGRGRPRRRQPRPPHYALPAVAGEEPAGHHHAPEAHHGGRRRALRRDHARRRDPGDQPAAEPRTGGLERTCPACSASPPRPC